MSHNAFKYCRRLLFSKWPAGLTLAGITFLAVIVTAGSVTPARASAGAGLPAAAEQSVRELPASAASCYGRSCAELDPYAKSCTASSSTTGSVTVNGDTATIVNEYSKLCDSNWVVGYLNTAAKDADWQIALDISTTDSSGYSEFTCIPDPVNMGIFGNLDEYCSDHYAGATGWPAWTDMVDGTHFTYGTIDMYNSAGAYEGDATANQ